MPSPLRLAPLAFALVLAAEQQPPDACASDDPTTAAGGGGGGAGVVSAPSMLLRKAVRALLPAAPKHWVGDGFHVHPVFANKAFTPELSPFLMFDYAAPKEFGPSPKRRGVGQHPHRGFETVTIAFQGEIEHADSTGESDTIRPGDVQWMTAGRGIIHGKSPHPNRAPRRVAPTRLAAVT